MNKKTVTIIILAGSIITAALVAAVFLAGLTLPGYSRPVDKTVNDGADGLVIEQKQRKIEISRDDETVWELPKEVLAQDFLVTDIDHDGTNELIVLCWKRGRYGKKKPTWVKHDEIGWSQHIFIYKIRDGKVVPQWMASDIGMKAESFEYHDGMLLITDTDKVTTKWVWRKWGLEKM